MEILKQGEFVTVARVFPNTPAEGAGVQEGDRIVQIDTQVTRGWSTTQVSNTLLGTPGTRVSVDVPASRRRAADSRDAHAGDHPHPAVPYSLVFDGTVGYVYAQRFSESTAEEIGQAVRSLEARGPKG
jgi:carboxyl-terminal processing protease